jgi:hypothetical protein
MRNQKTQFDDDDGHTIVDMNIEGTRWHDRSLKFAQRQASEAERKRTAAIYGERMTDSEARRYTLYSMLAGVALTAVMAATWGLLILFMTKVWFR